MQSTFWKKSDAIVALLIVLYALMLAAIPTFLPVADVKWIFSEAGPFEQLSVFAWLFAAVLIPLAVRPLGREAWACSLLFVCFAAREADWHKKFSTDSILKMNYYHYTEAPLLEKLIGGLVAVAFICLALYVGFVMLRFIFLRGGWRSRTGFWLAFAVFLIVFGKVVDRAPAELEKHGYVFAPVVGLYTAAFEEGLEMIHPLIFAWAVWLCRLGPSFLARKK